jgi:hypothetical protein
MKILSQPEVAVFVLVGCLAAAGRAQSISTQAEMHARIQALYNFSPSKVSAEQRTSKSAEMDTFWNEVKSHKDIDLPMLRRELEDPANPSFFFADGSGLLSTLSDAPDDQKLVVACLARVNFADFQSRQYLYQVHHLATLGVDVTPAALHILDDPKFEAYLPEHAYRMDQSACLLESLLPLPESVWLPSAMRRVKAEHEETALRSLLLLLYYAQTAESDDYLRSFAADPNKLKAARDFTLTLLKHERDLGIGKEPSRETEMKAREERRKRMFGLSDEAMDDLEDFTAKIARARTVPSVRR